MKKMTLRVFVRHERLQLFGNISLFGIEVSILTFVFDGGLAKGTFLTLT